MVLKEKLVDTLKYVGFGKDLQQISMNLIIGLQLSYNDDGEGEGRWGGGVGGWVCVSYDRQIKSDHLHLSQLPAQSEPAPPWEHRCQF
jgi:hypothetical protein